GRAGRDSSSVRRGARRRRRRRRRGRRVGARVLPAPGDEGRRRQAAQGRRPARRRKRSGGGADTSTGRQDLRAHRRPRDDDARGSHCAARGIERESDVQRVEEDRLPRRGCESRLEAGQRAAARGRPVPRSADPRGLGIVPYLWRHSVSELSALLERREVKAAEVAESVIERIDAKEPELNAFISRTGEAAIRHGRRVDEARAAGEQLPSLAGVPIGLKDIIATKAIRTTAGSKILENYRPPYGARV